MKKVIALLLAGLLLLPVNLVLAQTDDEAEADLGMFAVENCTDGLALTVERTLSPEDTLLVAWLYFDSSTGLALNQVLLTEQSGRETDIVLAHPGVPAGNEATIVAVVLSSNVVLTGALLISTLLDSGEAPDPETLQFLVDSIPVAVETLPVADCSIGDASPTQSNVELDLQALFESLVDFLEGLNLPAPNGGIG